MMHSALPRICRHRRRPRFRAFFASLAFAAAALLAAPSPTHALLTVGENATDELGQFTSPSSDATLDYTKGCVNNGASPIGFEYPEGGALDAVNHRLFITDGNNKRVLVFALTTGNLISSKTPVHVLGEPDYISCAGSGGQAGLSGLWSFYTGGGLAFDAVNNRLFVADTGNNRVMVFNTSTITDDMNASYVLGQANFTTTTAATTQSGLSGPTDVAFDSTNELLYVGDDNNNRVMVFNVAPGTIANGENASYVFGQSNFTSNTAATTQSGLSAGNAGSQYFQINLALDAADQLLYVGDGGNARVMVFPTASTGGPLNGNGENASYVLGQPNFTSSTKAVTQSGLSGPFGLAYDAVNSRLFVSDTYVNGHAGNRVMVFSTASLSNGENASAVLGQSSFITDTGQTTQSGLYEPTIPVFDSTNELLYVPDGTQTNNRVMIFNVAPPGTPTAVAQSGRDACAIMGGALYCWGYNTDGELGLGNNTQYTTPQQVGTDTTWTAITMGDPSVDPSACGIDNGKLYCWGNNAKGEAGQGNTSQYTTPQQVGTDTTWTAVSTSGNDTCGIDGGKLYCWGINSNGEDGQGNTTQYETPQQVGVATNWIAVSTGSKDTCGIEGSGGQGALYCWGANAIGEDGLGPGTGAASNLVFVTSTTYNGDLGSTAANAINDANTICAARATAGGLSGTFDAWIANSIRSPTAEFVHSVAPYVEANGTEIAGNWTGLISGSLESGITETELGTTLSSGDVWTNVSTSGTLESANSTSTNCNAWTNGTSSDSGYYGVIGATNATWTYSSSNTAACNVTNSLYCFQQNANPTASTTPQQVGTDTTWTAVSQGAQDTCGIDNGKLYCWGANAVGEDGLGNTIYEYWSPQQVGSATNWTTISIQYDGVNAGAACGIAGGALYCWGNNTNGNLGQGNTTASSTPEQVGTATNWSTAIYGADSVCGIEGGIVYCWGRNGNGNVGIGNTTTPQKSPQAVATLGVDENATDELGEYSSLSSTATVEWTQNGPNNGPTALGLYISSQSYEGIALDPVDHYLYVADDGNNRVMVYALNIDNSIPTASGGHTASYVLGQTTLDGASAAAQTQSGLSGPHGLAFDPANQRLFVADPNYCRVLVFSTAALASGENASYVLGSSSFTSGSCSTTTQSSFAGNGLQGLALDVVNQLLYVADAGNARVMVFNVAPGTIANGENASYVLGQSGFTSNTAAITQSGLSLPYGLAFDPVNLRLFVADRSANRVMVFNVAPASISSGENASYVLGQSNFTTGTSGTGAAQMNEPEALAYDPNGSRLFVGEYGGVSNGRVTVFNVPPAAIATGMSYSVDFIATGHEGQSGAEYPEGMFYDPGSSRLFLYDPIGYRIMIFDGGSLPAGDYFNP